MLSKTASDHAGREVLVSLVGHFRYCPGSLVSDWFKAVGTSSTRRTGSPGLHGPHVIIICLVSSLSSISEEEERR